VTSVVCPKDRGRISPRNVGTFYQPASVTWQKMVINIRINEKISSSFTEVNQAFRLMRCSLSYSFFNKPFFAPFHNFCRPITRSEHTAKLLIYSSLSTWPYTVNIDDNDRGLHFETVPTVCLDAIKGSTKNLPLWPAPREILEFGTAQV
jgi:hypothetical protein